MPEEQQPQQHQLSVKSKLQLANDGMDPILNKFILFFTKIVILIPN